MKENLESKSARRSWRTLVEKNGYLYAQKKGEGRGERVEEKRGERKRTKIDWPAFILPTGPVQPKPGAGHPSGRRSPHGIEAPFDQKRHRCSLRDPCHGAGGLLFNSRVHRDGPPLCDRLHVSLLKICSRIQATRSRVVQSSPDHKT